jgi:hypothetical protein
MLLDNAPLSSDSGLAIVEFLPSSVTARTQAVDQGVIASRKLQNWAGLLRTLVN